MSASNSAPAALLDTFLAPADAFRAVRERPTWAWLALLVIAVASFASVYTLFGGISPESLVEQQLAGAPEMPPDQLAAARSNMTQIAPYMAHIGVVMNLIMVLIFTTLFAGIYFLGERMLARERNGYGRWFAATAFSFLPGVLNGLGLIALAMLSSEPNLSIHLGNYASLNNLVLHLSPAESGFGFASALNLFFLWSIVLAAVAARVFSDMSWGKAILFGALPYLLIFVPWGALSLGG
jgi:hypothetical protein